MNKNPKHSRATRIAHMALAATIVTQLISSLIMVPPLDGNAADFAFTIHKYSGSAALIFALIFWVAIIKRQQGTSLSLLFPWFSAARLNSLGNDIKVHISDISRLKVPAYKAENSLASAIHGLGLLLMTGMAATGFAFVIALWNGLGEETAWVAYDLQVHLILANLVWAYLIAHTALAVIHHLWSNISLREMWSFGSNKAKAGVVEKLQKNSDKAI